MTESFILSGTAASEKTTASVRGGYISKLTSRLVSNVRNAQLVCHAGNASEDATCLGIKCSTNAAHGISEVARACVPAHVGSYVVSTAVCTV